MRHLAWTPKSKRAFKRLIKGNPALDSKIRQVLTQLTQDPFHPSLRTHKLSGNLSDLDFIH